MDTAILSSLIYVAQGYSDNAYGSNVYQYVASDSDGKAGTGQQQDGGVLAPVTGFFQGGPEILVPVIIGGAVIIAAIVLLIKKAVSRRKAMR